VKHLATFFRHQHKILAYAVLVSVVLFFSSPSITHGVWPFDIIADFLGSAIAKLGYDISYFFVIIFGALIAVQVYFSQVLLQVSTNVMASPVVQVGFKVSLQLVNLGFVLVIIVIAVATILRLQSYGMKQNLLRLIAAAILVNFSLVIAGVFIGFAGNLTAYLLNSLPGPGSSNGILGFADSLAGAFNPQKFLNPQDNKITTAAGGDIAEINAFKPDAGGGITGGFASLFFGVIFTIFNLVIIVIVLAVFNFMLLVRYVALGFLLFIMPFAWLMWIFEDTRHLWRRWWNEFIRWTFFAPIVVFSIWLVILTGAAMRSGNVPYGSDVAQINITSQNPVIKFFLGALGNVLSNLLTPALNNLILTGIMVGGLYMANRLSIIGAGAGINAVQKTGSWMMERSGRLAQRAGSRTFEKVGGDKLTEKLQKANVPGWAGGRLMSYGLKMAGRGLDKLRTKLGREALLEKGRKDISAMSEDYLARNFETLRFEQKIAALSRYKDTILPKLNLDKIFRQEAAFRRYGQGKLFEDIQKRTLANERIVTAARAIERGGENAMILDFKRDEEGNIIMEKGKPVAAQQLAKDVINWEQRKIFNSLTPEDLRNLPTDLFKRYKKDKPYLQLTEGAFEQIRNNAIELGAKFYPQMITRVSSKLGAEDFDKFQTQVINAILGKKEGEVIQLTIKEKVKSEIEEEKEEQVIGADGSPLLDAYGKPVTKKVKRKRVVEEDRDVPYSGTAEELLKNPKTADALIKHLEAVNKSFAEALKSSVAQRIAGFYEGARGEVAPPPPQSPGTPPRASSPATT